MFENYFSASAVAEIERLIAGEQAARDNLGGAPNNVDGENDAAFGEGQE